MIGPRPKRDAVLDADEETLTLDVGGFGAVAIQLTGTWVGTVAFEGSVDGRTFVALNLVPSNSATAASSATANGVWSGNVAGYAIVRARVDAYTSGTVGVTIQATVAAGRY